MNARIGPLSSAARDWHREIGFRIAVWILAAVIIAAGSGGSATATPVDGVPPTHSQAS
jgi:hypothetical protein